MLEIRAHVLKNAYIYICTISYVYIYIKRLINIHYTITVLLFLKVFIKFFIFFKVYFFLLTNLSQLLIDCDRQIHLSRTRTPIVKRQKKITISRGKQNWQIRVVRSVNRRRRPWWSIIYTLPFEWKIPSVLFTTIIIIEASWQKILSPIRTNFFNLKTIGKISLKRAIKHVVENRRKKASRKDNDDV